MSHRRLAKGSMSVGEIKAPLQPSITRRQNTEPLLQAGTATQTTSSRDSPTNIRKPSSSKQIITGPRVASEATIGTKSHTVRGSEGTLFNPVFGQPNQKTLHRTTSVVDGSWFAKTPKKSDPNINIPQSQAASTNLNSDLPIFTSEDALFFKNSKLSKDVIPYVFRKVLDWGCSDKTESETYMEYVEKKGISITQLKSKYKMFGSIIEQIKVEKSSDSFDVTLIYALIRAACSGVADVTDDVWKQSDETKLECLLRDAKNWRNNIAHEIKTVAVAPDTLQKAEVALNKLLNKAGETYSKSDAEVQTELDIVNEKVRSLENVVMTDLEKMVIQVQNKIHEDGKAEVLEHWKKSCKSDILFSIGEKVDLLSILHPINLIVRSSGSDSNTLEENKLRSKHFFNIWPGFEDIPQITIVHGIAGAGKSTLMKVIGQDFLGIISNRFDRLRDFDLMHYIKCRDHTSSFREYLNRVYPNTMRSISVSDAETAISNSKILHLIDGYDERNEKSNALILELLRRFKTSPGTKFVFTVRPYATRPLQEMILGEGMDCQVCSIVDIQQGKEQIEFLERYDSSLSGNQRDSKMIEIFKCLPENITVHFRQPINLVLFCHVFRHSPTNVSKWTLEHTVLGETFKLCQNMAFKRMQRDSLKIRNSEIVIDKLMKEICIFALKCLNQDKIDLDQRSYNAFKTRCYDMISSEISYDEAFSTFFLTKSTPSIESDTSYHFYHKSLQEYMAAKALAVALEEHPNKTMQTVLNVLVEDNISAKDFVKLEDTLKFTIVLLFSSESNKKQVTKRLAEIIRVLQKSNVVGFGYWSSVLTECGCDSTVAEMIAGAVNVEGSWRISNKEVEAAVHLLRYVQPSGIIIHIPENATTPSSLKTLLKTIKTTNFRGRLLLGLYNHYYNSDPCDDLVEQLSGSSCDLQRFVGCLARNPGSSLVKLLQHGAWVDIALVDFNHDLDQLWDTQLSCLNVRISHRLTSDALMSPTPSRPLPVTGLITVCLDQLPQSATKWAVEMLKFLVPINSRYDSVQLDSCALSDDEVWDVRRQLVQDGFKVSTPAGVLKLREDWDLIIPGWTTAKWGVKMTYDDGTRNIRL